MRTGSLFTSSLGHIAYSIAVAGGAIVGGMMAYAIVKAVLRK
jgi:hypothetical protein